MEQYQINANNILRFFLKIRKNKHKKGKVAVFNTWKHSDRVLSVLKTKIPTECREKGIRCFKN